MSRASLPMYNLPEMRADNDAFWQALRVELLELGVADVPEALEDARRPVPDCIEPDTLFTQVCGWPLQTIYAGQAIMLGVPVYDAAYCAGPVHAGVFVVHRDASYETVADLRGCRFVFNSVHSNSGMNLPRRLLADLAGGAPFFGAITETHSHPGNLERIAQGEADATCVDCVTYAFVARHRPQTAARLRVLAPTPPSPSLPFVTAAATEDDIRSKLVEALMRVARDSQWAQVRSNLLLRDIVPADPAAYRVLLDYEGEAEQRGYKTMI